jgi:hypothetical protein
MFSFIDGFPRHMFNVFVSRGFLPSQAVPAAGNKMQDLDAILKKYTSEVENHLRGATFVAVDKAGKSNLSTSLKCTYALRKYLIFQVCWVSHL